MALWADPAGAIALLCSPRKPACCPVRSARSSSGYTKRLPEPTLLEAAHIVVNADEQIGQPVVTNRVPLSKIQHADFDAQLDRHRPDFRIQVSDRLLDLHGSPF